jgi:hypothetical protein
MDVQGHGSEWDEKRGQSRYWARLDAGQEHSGFGDTVEDARLDLRRQLTAAGYPLEQLGGLAPDILSEIASDEDALRRCPGGHALAPQLDYAKAFTPGAAISVEFIEGASTGVIEVEEAGLLDVPSGQIAAYDPLITSREPFAFAVEPGRYPVLVSLANIEGEPRRRTIAACVRFSAAAVTEWKQALLADENPRDLAPREMFGYGVDSGTGCFADAEVNPQDLDEPEPIEEYMQVTPGLIAFTTGWGDGNYATFLGLDAEGKPAMLVTDFGLVSQLRS